MKKNIFKTIILAFCTICAGVFSACSMSITKEQIATPSITVNEGNNGNKIVVITEVEHASSYTVRIDGADIDTYTTYIDCTDLLSGAKVYTLSVRANAVDGYKSSDFSEPITYSSGTTLGTPTVKIYDKVLGWTHDISAANYTVTITKPNGEQISNVTNSNRYDFSHHLDLAGVYTFSVTANSSKLHVNNSDPSAPVVYAHTKQFATPINLSVNEVDGNVYLNFIDTDDSGNYTVLIDDTTYYVNDESVSLTALGHNFSEAKRYFISVRSNAQVDKFYVESEFSEQAYFDRYLELSTPADCSITDNGNQVLLSWSSVNNARTYSVYLNDSTEVYAEGVSANQIALDKTLLDANGQISFQVLAEGYNYYLTSLKSDAVYFNTIEKLATPTNLAVNLVGSNVTLTWGAVSDASEYEIEVNGDIVATTSSTSIVLNSYFPIAETYTMRVRAIPQGTTKVSSNFSGTIKYTYVTTLQAPTVNSVVVDDNEYILHFTGNDENAQSYRIFINDSLSKIDVTTSPVNITGLLNNSGSYTVAVQAVAAQASLYRDSQKSNNFAFNYMTPLAIPQNVKVDETNNILMWDAVDNAAKYEIFINDTSFESITNSFDITEYYEEAGEYTFRVRALPVEDSYFVASEFNEIVKVHTITLSAPTNVRVYTETNGKIYVSFELVNNAQSYEINITRDLVDYITPKPTTTTSPFEITQYLNEAGIYTIYVQAIGSGYYISSSMSSMVQIQKNITLSAPTGINITKDNDSESLFLNFTPVENAAGYKAIINGVEISGITAPGYDIQDYVDFEGNYAIQMQTLGDHDEGYTNSEYGAVKIYTHVFTTKYDYMRCDVFMYGEEVDYHVDSYKEFKLIVWYNYLYRNESYNVYLPSGIPGLAAAIKQEYADYYLKYFGIDITTITFDNIDLFMYMLYAYPEYVATNNGIVSSQHKGGNVYSCGYDDIMTFDHNVTFDADAIASQYSPIDILNYKNNTFTAINNPNQDINYLPSNERDRSNEFNDFLINSRDSLPVTNTEQLLMAVTYGRKPAFVTDQYGNSPAVAQTVYENAKYVLRRIIKSSYTDFEKVDAIYTWLTTHNIYDYDLIEFSEAVGDGSVSTIGQYKDFYLEGVLYDLDNSMAVCDGIAKAFVLLCQIEGIDAYKCNGVAGTGNTSTWGNHAWNKVKIGGYWYAVDSTWDDAIVYTNNITGNYEYIGSATHEYFLRTDEYINATHLEEFPNREGVSCSQEYGYKAASKYQYGYHGAITLSDENGVFDLVIGNNNLDASGNEIYIYELVLAELTQLLEYCYDNDIGVVEFRMSDSYINSQKSYDNGTAYNNYWTLVEAAVQEAEIPACYIPEAQSGFDGTYNFHYLLLV